MLLRALLLALLLAGCTGTPATDAPRSVTPTGPPGYATTQDSILEEGTLVLGAEGSTATTNTSASFPVTIGTNATHLRLEIDYDAVDSVNPHVFGLPECEWRLETVIKGHGAETVDCARVVPGSFDVRVEHDSGSLRIHVRVVARVPHGP